MCTKVADDAMPIREISLTDQASPVINKFILAKPSRVPITSRLDIDLPNNCLSRIKCSYIEMPELGIKTASTGMLWDYDYLKSWGRHL